MTKDPKDLVELIETAEDIYIRKNKGRAMSGERRDTARWMIQRKYENSGRESALLYFKSGELWKDLALRMGD